MRWRATKRLSENWLTKVEVVREKHRERREKFQREREKRKMKAGSGATPSLAGKGSNQGVISNPQPQFSVPESQSQPAAPPHPELTSSQLPVAPSMLHHSPSAPPSANGPASSYGSSQPHMPSSSLAALPTFTPVYTYPSCTQSVPREHTSPVSPKFPHAPYDPRTPDLALEELAHIPLDSEHSNPTHSESTSLSPDLNTLFITEAMQCVQQYIDERQLSQSPLPYFCSYPSQDVMPPISLLPSQHSTFLMPEGSTGDSSEPFNLQEYLESHSHVHHHSHANHEPFDLSSLSVNHAPVAQGPPEMIPVQCSFPCEPTPEEKLMWHVWLLTQAPPGTVADVILRNPQVSQQSNLAPMFFNLFPNFKGNKNEAARVKILTASVHEGQHSSAALHETPLADTNADSNWTWASLPSVTFPLEGTSVSSMLAPRAIIIDPAYLVSQPSLSFPGSQSADKDTVSQDPSTPPVPSSLSTSRPMPVLKTQDLSVSLPSLSSHVDSPLSPVSAHRATTAFLNESSEHLHSPSTTLYPQYMPVGNRLFRIARVGDADVLRPSYWFEPDTMATERMRNVVNLLEQFGGWVSGPNRADALERFANNSVYRGDRNVEREYSMETGRHVDLMILQALIFFWDIDTTGH